jgi:ATP-binding cassette subfamily B protein
VLRHLDRQSWPLSRLGEAIIALARMSHLLQRTIELPIPPQSLIEEDEEILGRWIEGAASAVGMEAESIEVSYGGLEGFLRQGGPALLGLQNEGEPRFLALIRAKGKTLRLLSPGLEIFRARLDDVRATLSFEMERNYAPKVDQLLAGAGIDSRHWERARAAMLREHLSSVRRGCCWMLRISPGTSFWRQLNQAGILSRGLGFVGIHIVEYFFLLLAWWIVGRGALEGRLDHGWFLAWALLLLSLVPLQLAVGWWQGLFGLGVVGLLRRRLLYGTLKLEPEEMRRQGVGQQIGRVVESEVLASATLHGGAYAFIALVDLVVAAGVILVGAGGTFHFLLLLAWVMGSFTIGWRYYAHRRRWTGSRLEMTHDLVERMVGHRTRLAQGRKEFLHEGEDQALEDYLRLSISMDRGAILLSAFLARGWLVAGIIGLAPALVSGQSSVALIAVGVGGVLLASQAFNTLSVSMFQLADAAVAWGKAKPLFEAATRGKKGDATVFEVSPSDVKAGSERNPEVIHAHDLVFRYRSQGSPVLKHCSLLIQEGDHLLLEGPSGGGKSTFISLLTSLRLAESGLLLLRGLDHSTLGSRGWHRLVACAPQFHENYVFTGTLAFNLLMGRRWPPRGKDFLEAEAICRELGLGDLLDRMPAGILQVVGETGWRLSHGERSRVYIGRALLQNTDLVILDESFGALDPETLQQVMRCVIERSRTLMVIAHS